MRVASLTIHKDELTFSAGHFTIFSATEREALHGHNYYVSVSFEVEIEHNGLSFDFNHKKIPFLKEDVVVLPISNITIEELSHWFLQHLTDQPQELAKHNIRNISVDVYNGPGQSSGARFKE